MPGLLIVLMGIMLDRTTTAASQRSEIVARGGGEDPNSRRIVLGGAFVAVCVAVWYSRYTMDAALFPETGWGPKIADKSNIWMDSFVRLDGLTGGFKDLVSYGLLNPMQDLLANSPWWLAFAAMFLLCAVVGCARGRADAALPDRHPAARPVERLHAGAQHDDRRHLAGDAAALVFGVMMARSRAADLTLRPLLDAGQTIPAFVYLIPALALFGSTRFTAIVAAVIYAAPAAIKLVADGVSGVSVASIEASRSVGSTTWQEIVKVQLPMAKGSLVLATNQGLLYVLAMVVIGGLVGAGALGYDVILGISHADKWGKGLAAGLSLVLMGIWIDRVARAAAERPDQAAGRGAGLQDRRLAARNLHQSHRVRAPVTPQISRHQPIRFAAATLHKGER